MVCLVGYTWPNRWVASPSRHRPRKLIPQRGIHRRPTFTQQYWVFFMGAGPAILMGILLWWNVFRRSKWPLQMTVIILAVRVAALALQLINIAKPTTSSIQDRLGHTILCDSAYSIWNFHALRATNQQR